MAHSLINDCSGAAPQLVQLTDAEEAELAAVSAPTPAETAAAAVTAGLAVVSTATPALNGTYGVDPASRANVTAVMIGIAAGLGLPGGAETFSYFDVAGAAHAFDQAQFVALAATLRDYVYALDLYAAGVGPLPSATATIP